MGRGEELFGGGRGLGGGRLGGGVKKSSFSGGPHPLARPARSNGPRPSAPAPSPFAPSTLEPRKRPNRTVRVHSS